MKNKYVSPQSLQEETRRLRVISEYNYFTDVSEEENKDDQLSMDDFNAPAPGGEEPGGAPPPADPAGGAPAPPATPGAPGEGTPPEDPFGQQGSPGGMGGAPEGEMSPEDPMAAGDGAMGDTQEVDVTDIVQDTKAVNQKADSLMSSVEQTTAKVDELLKKINGLEQSVQKMDQAVGKIDAIYKEVELSKPPSPEEVKEVMAQNSYPFNVTLDSYGKEGTPKNQTDLETRKNKLSLSNLLSDFNERELRQSFSPPDPFEDKMSRSMPQYRV